MPTCTNGATPVGPDASAPIQVAAAPRGEPGSNPGTAQSARALSTSPFQM